MIACYAAGVLIKECSKLAFSKFHRGVLAVDVIDQINEIFYEENIDKILDVTGTTAILNSNTYMVSRDNRAK